MIQGKLVFKKGVSIQTVNIEELEAVVVDDYICTLFFKNGKKEWCVQSLKEMLLKLPDSFVKISRETIVNLEKIKEINLRKREINMESGQSFRFSVRKMKVLKDLLFKP
jgi:DNA-binding LytR/AlgR family response regulator